MNRFDSKVWVVNTCPSRGNNQKQVVVVVVFTSNRSFYPTTSAVHPVSFLILHPREIQTMWSQTGAIIICIRNAVRYQVFGVCDRRDITSQCIMHSLFYTWINTGLPGYCAKDISVPWVLCHSLTEVTKVPGKGRGILQNLQKFWVRVRKCC